MTKPQTVITSNFYYHHTSSPSNAILERRFTDSAMATGRLSVCQRRGIELTLLADPRREDGAITFSPTLTGYEIRIALGANQSLNDLSPLTDIAADHLIKMLERQHGLVPERS